MSARASPRASRNPPVRTGRPPRGVGSSPHEAHAADDLGCSGLSARRRALAAGREAELRVATYLEGQGFRVLDRNWRGGGGELDVVVQRDSVLRFVEVKLRDADDPLADEAIPAHKRARLRSAARAWLSVHEMDPDDVAFLIVWIAPDGSMRLVDDAFDG